ncbi:MAG: hypothetical protein LBM70_02865, partial [Victivallales bacterium]|nr:hypothetical protein [Victivallales bacterium]
TQQTVVKFPWVIASKPGWNIMVSGSSNHCAEHGFLAGSSANYYHKVQLEKGGVLEFTGLYGICDIPDVSKKLWAFRNNVKIPEETQSSSTAVAAEIIVPYVKEGIPIGKFSGWSNIPLLAERSAVDFYRPTTSNTWSGAEDLSFKLFGAFDQKNLYLRIRVTDDQFFQKASEPSGIWAGDCIQIAFDPLRAGTMSDNYIEIGISPTDKPIIWGWRHPDSSKIGDLSKIIALSTKRDADGYECEVAIPWSFLSPFEFQRGKFNCNIVVLDSDDFAGQNWMGITDGIAGGKDPSLFKTWQLAIPGDLIIASEQDCVPKLFFPSDIVIGTSDLEFSATVIANKDMLPGELKIQFSGGISYTEKLQEGFNSFSHVIRANTLPTGENTPVVELYKNGKKISSQATKITIVDRTYVESLAAKIEEKISRLQPKIRVITRTMGEPSYLQATVNIAKFLTDLAKSDVSKDTILRAPTINPKKELVKSDPAYLLYTFSRAFINLSYLDNWMTQSLLDADRMLEGKLPVLTVPKPPRGVQPQIVNGGFYIGDREYFFVGPNTWYMKIDQIPLIASMGMNLVNLFSINGKILVDWIAECEKSGVYFTRRYCGGSPNELNSGYLEKQQEILEKNKEIDQRVNNSPAALYYITEEEGFRIDRDQNRITADFTAYLKNKFGTLQALNKTLGISLKDYGDIGNALALKEPALKYEFYLFESARQIDAVKKIHALKKKFLSRPLSSHFSALLLMPYDTLQIAADWEGNFAEFEVPGFDAGIFPDSGSEWAMCWSLGETLPCDLLRSFYPDRPIGNNEGHVIPNGYRKDVSYELSYAQNMLPFLHGRNAVSVWVWADDYHSPWGNFTFTRANAFHGLMDVYLDVNRLAPEIAAFRKTKAPVALLYNMASF